MDIQQIKLKAAKKNYNEHYLDRYLKLMNSFKNDEIFIANNYTEIHHILPKANDMFPEYACLKENSWNKIILTARQHYIAHWLLWKIFGGSQSYVFMCFRTQTQNKNNQRQCKILPKIYESVKKDAAEYKSIIFKGKATYIDKDGTKIYCRTDDPRVLTGELISTTKGRKGPSISKEGREKISLSRKGKRPSDESIEKQKASLKRTLNEPNYISPHIGMKRSDTTRKNISKNHADVSGSNNPMYGRKMSEETKEKIRITKAKNRALRETKSRDLASQ